MTKKLGNMKEQLEVLRRLVQIEEQLIFLTAVQNTRKGMDKH